MLHSASRLTYHWRCILLHGSGGIGATLVILPFHPLCCSFCSVCFVSYYCVFSCAGPVQRSAERWICPRCLILWAKTGSTSSTFLLHRTNWLNWLDEDCHHFQCSDFLQSTDSSVFLHAIPNNSWNYRFAPEIVQRFRSFWNPPWPGSSGGDFQSSRSIAGRRHRTWLCGESHTCRRWCRPKYLCQLKLGNKCDRKVEKKFLNWALDEIQSVSDSKHHSLFSWWAMHAWLSAFSNYQQPPNLCATLTKELAKICYQSIININSDLHGLR